MDAAVGKFTGNPVCRLPGLQSESAEGCSPETRCVPPSRPQPRVSGDRSDFTGNPVWVQYGREQSRVEPGAVKGGQSQRGRDEAKGVLVAASLGTRNRIPWAARSINRPVRQSVSTFDASQLRYSTSISAVAGSRRRIQWQSPSDSVVVEFEFVTAVPTPSLRSQERVRIALRMDTRSRRNGGADRRLAFRAADPHFRLTCPGHRSSVFGAPR